MWYIIRISLKLVLNEQQLHKFLETTTSGLHSVMTSATHSSVINEGTCNELIGTYAKKHTENRLLSNILLLTTMVTNFLWPKFAENTSCNFQHLEAHVQPSVKSPTKEKLRKTISRQKAKINRLKKKVSQQIQKWRVN
jgi:hypothetical protein